MTVLKYQENTTELQQFSKGILKEMPSPLFLQTRKNEFDNTEKHTLWQGILFCQSNGKENGECLTPL